MDELLAIYLLSRRMLQYSAVYCIYTSTSVNYCKDLLSANLFHKRPAINFNKVIEPVKHTHTHTRFTLTMRARLDHSVPFGFISCVHIVIFVSHKVRRATDRPLRIYANFGRINAFLMFQITHNMLNAHITVVGTWHARISRACLEGPIIIISITIIIIIINATQQQVERVKECNLKLFTYPFVDGSTSCVRCSVRASTFACGKGIRTSWWATRYDSLVRRRTVRHLERKLVVLNTGNEVLTFANAKPQSHWMLFLLAVNVQK